MKKIVVIISVLLMISSNCLSQNRSIRLSGAFVQGRALSAEKISIPYDGLLSVDADVLNLLPCLSSGFNVGVGQAFQVDLNNVNLPDGTKSALALHCGLGVDLHLLRLMRCETHLWDWTLGASFGYVFSHPTRPTAEYNINMAVACYPFAHWGAFLEGGWGRFKFGHYDPDVATSYGSILLKAGIGYRF